MLEGSATFAVVTAMLLGALQTAGDLQNGMSRALILVEPRRLRVLGAQLLVSMGLGAGVGVAAALLADSTQAALATCVVVLWSYAIEPFISTLSYNVYIFLPGGARESLVQHILAHSYIPPPVVGGLILAGIASAAALVPALTFTRQDTA